MSEQIEEKDILTFEERMLKRILADQTEGETYLAPFHAWCKEMYAYYYNAQNYEALKLKNKFPSTAIQEDVDSFIADARDKLFYANRPCTIYGREETDKPDAEAKQEMMNYQDDVIGIFDIMGSALRDVALYRLCAFQVEYDEEVTTEWEAYEDIVPATDENGQMLIDQMGRQMPLIGEDGNPVVDSGWRIVEVPLYKGAVVKRIDPLNLLWTQDKKKTSDRHPIMVRGNLSREEMNKKYFIQSAIAEIKEAGEESQYEDPTWEKKQKSGENASMTGSKKPYQYVEWHGMANKAETYHFMLQTGQVSEEDMELFMHELSSTEPDDECRVIFGVANNNKIIQGRRTPFKKINAPNIILGNMSPGEDSMIGDSISRKIEAVQKAEESTYGMLIENIKQAVDAFWIINSDALIKVEGKGNAVINKAGGVLYCNENVNNVAKRVEQPPVAGDIYNLLNIFKQARQDQGGLQDSVIGKGDPNAETLGEARQVMASASLRMRDYLKTFESTFVKPLYQMRNDINTEYLTEDYIYRVIGEKGIEWRTISPQTVRTPVDFICESATRETNRSVIIQQTLQVIQLAPLASQQMPPQPVRIDLMLADLVEAGFGMSQDKIKRYFPNVALEEAGINVNVMPEQQPMDTTGRGQELAQPDSEEQAIVQNEAKNNVQV